MTNKNGSLYEFGDFIVDTTQSLLLRNGEQVKLPQKTFELLLFFVQNPNQVIDKETLMLEVWKDSFVEDANLAVHISNLRKILNGDVNGKSAIETFPKVGYRFNAEVRLAENGKPSSTNGKGIALIDLEPEFIARKKELKFGVKNNRRIGFFILAVVVLIGSGYALKKWFQLRPLTEQSMTRVPFTEQSTSIALSPNGEYIAHSATKEGKYTLIMTHIGSNSSAQLLPPDSADYWGMTFSKDSSFLYFVKPGKETASLFRIPILGNNTTKILDNLGYRFSFAPDGERFCFVRKISNDETAIMTANSDGSDERVIATRWAPEYYSTFDISWSPDGHLIATVAGDSNKKQQEQIVGIDVKTGEETPISDSKWTGSDGIEWLGDGSGLIAGLIEPGNSPTQVWFVPYLSGEPRRITNDLNNYGSVGVSADGKTIMAGQFKNESRLWLLANDGSGQAKPLTTGQHSNFQWVRWASDAKLVFGSSAGGNRDVWIMNADGTGERQLTEKPGSNVMPAASADGSFIVFASNRRDKSVHNLWRIDGNGENPRQLTSGSGEMLPRVSPDGKWVYYTSGTIGGPLPERTIWKVSIDGGEVMQLVKEPSYDPDISPDGKLLACWYKPNNETPWQVAIFPADGGSPIKLLDVPPRTFIQWTNDGKGISYVKTVDAVSNLWTQPIDEGPPKQVTQYTSDTIFNCDWSRDGRLVCSRLSRTTDTVLIRNFR